VIAEESTAGVSRPCAPAASRCQPAPPLELRRPPRGAPAANATIAIPPRPRSSARRSVGPPFSRSALNGCPHRRTACRAAFCAPGGSLAQQLPLHSRAWPASSSLRTSTSGPRGGRRRLRSKCGSSCQGQQAVHPSFPANRKDKGALVDAGDGDIVDIVEAAGGMSG
jgi:hypothetical protein